MGNRNLLRLILLIFNYLHCFVAITQYTYKYITLMTYSFLNDVNQWCLSADAGYDDHDVMTLYGN